MKIVLSIIFWSMVNVGFCESSHAQDKRDKKTASQTGCVNNLGSDSRQVGSGKWLNVVERKKPASVQIIDVMGDTGSAQIIYSFESKSDSNEMMQLIRKESCMNVTLVKIKNKNNISEATVQVSKEESALQRMIKKSGGTP